MSIADAQIENFIQTCEDIKDIPTLLRLASGFFKENGFYAIAFHYLPNIGAQDYSTEKIVHLDKSVTSPNFGSWVQSYKEVYLKKHDPIEEFCLKKGGGFWLNDLTLQPDFQSDIQQSFVKGYIQTISHGVVIPVYGPRRSRGCFFLLTHQDTSPLTLIMKCSIEYICHFIHRCYCYIRAEKGRKLAFTRREREVMQLLPLGLSNRDIAIALDISANTVSSYMKQIFLKLDASDRVTATLRAYTLDLID